MTLDKRHRGPYCRLVPVHGEQGQERSGYAHMLIAGAGILGVTAGSIGVIQAAEPIRVLIGKGSVLVNRFLMWDGTSSKSMFVDIQKNHACAVCSVWGMVN